MFLDALCYGLFAVVCLLVVAQVGLFAALGCPRPRFRRTP